jgi:hypothetical protein
MPKKKTAITKKEYEALNRADELMVEAVRAIHTAESAYLAVLRNAHKSKNKRVYDSCFSSLGQFYEITGQVRRAKAVLRERERADSKSLEIPLAWARFFGTTLDEPDRALEHLRRIKLPRRPKRDEIDAYYNALAYRGLMLLEAKKKREAIAAMGELARFTEQHSKDILFFCDMFFVRAMVHQKLALKSCKRYLGAIAKRNQVAHDAEETKALLAVLSTV